MAQKTTKNNAATRRQVTDREGSPLGPRLHLARRKAGISLKSLADATDSMVSHETVRQYELGTKAPDATILATLARALGVTPDELTAPLEISLGEIEFRKTARTSSADRQAIREELLDLLERYLEIEDILELDQSWRPPVLKVPSPNHADEHGDEMALALRKKWNLGLEPIHDLTKLLEERGLKVLVPHASVDISGMTCEVQRSGRPSVFALVVNRAHTLERRRFTLAHELAHRILDFEGLNGKKAESLCNRFAGALLVPEATMRRELGPGGQVPTYRELMLTKRFFRVSAAMLVLRLKQTGFIDVSQRDRFFKTIGNNWRTMEPEPLEEWSSEPLEPPRFERLVFQALGRDFISPGKAAELLRVNIREIQRGIDGGYGMD